jgi:small subunit ribosomal protein S17
MSVENQGALGRHRRQLEGIVVSTSAAKTAVVKVTRTFLHPQVRKYVRRSKKYMAHDEHSEAAVGDQVIIEECRPLSARKRWRLRSITRKNTKV